MGCLVAPLSIVGLIVLAAAFASWHADGPFVVAIFGLVAALTALGVALVFVATKLGPAINAWSLVAYIPQLGLLPAGALLVAISIYLSDHAGSPANPGTDGPFADGITGGIGLMGLGLVIGGGLVVPILSWTALEVLVAKLSRQMTDGDTG